MNDTKEDSNMGAVATVPKNQFALAGANALMQRTLAEVRVAVMMAKEFPRDKILAKEKLMNDCCREDLAAVSMYSYSRGGTEITGPSIRLAESAKNAWGNMQSGWRELSRSTLNGVGISEVEAFAWDCENNTRSSVSFTVKHWRDTKQGGYALKEERDIYELCANQAARRERACILKIIDGDMIEAAVTQCHATLNSKVQVTPERIASMVKMFAEYNVTKEQLEKRVQRRLDTINGPVMISLTKIYNSMRDGMSKAADWFEIEEKKTDDAKTGTKTEQVKEKLKKEKAKAEGADETTGEITADGPKPKKTDAPVGFKPDALPIRPLPGNASESDFITWADDFVSMVARAPDVNSLFKLNANNEKTLNAMSPKHPEMFEDCMKAFNDRRLELSE